MYIIYIYIYVKELQEESIKVTEKLTYIKNFLRRSKIANNFAFQYFYKYIYVLIFNYFVMNEDNIKQPIYENYGYRCFKWLQWTLPILLRCLYMCHDWYHNWMVIIALVVRFFLPSFFFSFLLTWIWGWYIRLTRREIL